MVLTRSGTSFFTTENNDISDSESELSECSEDFSDFSDINEKGKKNNIKLNSRFIRKRKKSNVKNISNKKNKIEYDEVNSDDSTEIESQYSESSQEIECDNIYKNIESIVNQEFNNISEKKMRINEYKMKKDLTQKEICKYNTEFKLINKEICKVPIIKNILETNIPFKIKCQLMEKLDILDNLNFSTFEHLKLKKDILNEIEKYKSINLSKKDYKQYDIDEKKLNKNTFDTMPINLKILSSKMSLKNKIIVYKKYKSICDISECSSEYNKNLKWINTAINIPTKITKLPLSNIDNVSGYLSNIKYYLDSKIYGMEKTKEHILCIINNKITNPNVTGNSLALQGVQGVGKTQIVKVLSEAISLPFYSIPLGGATDASHLVGHGFTYEGSKAGAIVDALTSMKSLNGIIFFDEIDKISKTKHGEEISKSLLHITDFTQNNEFSDVYLGTEFKIDLSKIWFIYSLNYKELVDKTLIDRIPVIIVDGYNNKQKRELSEKFLIPEALEKVNMNKNDIKFTEDSLNYIITETNKLYTTETSDKDGNTGVRKLKDVIYNIIIKLNLLKSISNNNGIELSFSIKNFSIPFTVEKYHIDTLNVLNNTESNNINQSMYL